ncbi:MAG: hypothetical protein GY755_08760 [Chloroflexi bacterium]|nr:hypothetical protein [Chloroflexota bacterium]
MELIFHEDDSTGDNEIWFDVNTIIADDPKSNQSDVIYYYMWKDYEEAPGKSKYAYELTKSDYRKTMVTFMKDYIQLPVKSMYFISVWKEELEKYNLQFDVNDEEKKDNI